VPELPNREGLEAACREVYVKHQAALMRHISRKVRGRQNAEDILGDTWLGYLTYAERNGVPDSPKAMLWTIADNKIKDWYNRAAKVEFCQGDFEMTELLDGRGSIRIGGEAIERESELEGAVGALRPRQKEAIVLRYYRNLPVKGVAQLMGIKPDTAKEHIANALKALRKILGGRSRQR
jgi:RNA polymerase sigma factor (sigma-70 family)